MNEEKIKLTEAEQTEAGRFILQAAFKALGSAPADMENEDASKLPRLIVRALAEAEQASRSEYARLSALKGVAIYIDVEPHQAVATAFWLWSEKIDLPMSEVHANSVAGARLLGFAQGMAAARAMAEALDYLSDDQMFCFTGGGAKKLNSTLDS